MLDFYNNNFGRFLIEQTGDKEYDVAKSLASNYTILSDLKDGKTKDAKKVLDGEGNPIKERKTSRLVIGWAIIRPGLSSMRMVLADKTGIDFQEKTPSEALYEELKNWDMKTPRMFLMFEKATIPPANLFRTFDKRHVFVCSAKKVDVFDFTQPPGEGACDIHKSIWKLKLKEEGSV